MESSTVAGIRTLREQGKVPEALTDDELRGLIATVRPQLRSIVSIAADTDLQKSEL